MASSPPAPDADAALPQPFLGLDVASLPRQRELGLDPDAGTLWVGAWIQRHGWGETEEALRRAAEAGVVPIVQLWYWGDSIGPDAVQRGCHDPLHGVDLTLDGWDRLVRGLADRLNAILGSGPAVVVLEPEFNKNGIETWGPMDSLLAARARRLRSAAPGATVVLGFGGWGRSCWHRFREAATAAHWTGVQALRGATQDDLPRYRGVAQRILEDVQALHDLFGEPVLLTDLGLSSHPPDTHEAEQADALAQVLEGFPELQAAGLRGLLYRALVDDPGFDTANHFGEAERRWGLVRADGSPKPALDAWRRAIRGVR